MSVNYGDVFDAVAAAVPADAPAVICDGVTTPWSAFDKRSNALARVLIAEGLTPGSKVSLLMRNGPDYMIAFVACLKARLAPVNVNYRYGVSEIAYLLENSDSEALIFDAEFSPLMQALRNETSLKLWISARARSDNALFLDDIYTGDGARLTLSRAPDDLFLLYTGGTTGLPKGVMWPASALWGVLAASRALDATTPPPMTIDALAAQIAETRDLICYHIAPPLMHGTGLFAAVSVMSRGGAIVCSGRASFDPQATLAEMVDHRCDGLVIVGDAFATPILEVLRANPARYDLSHISMVVSSGMMWSPEVKRGLLAFMPNAVLSDGLGASESASLGFSVTTRDAPPEEASFTLANAKVLDPETLQPVAPGSGQIGVIAKAGDLPLGYYKDPERTARTYVMIDGERHMLGGDHAVVEANGVIRLLGRGSHCINTAGEKVYPEEVEEALKTHAAVSDALVFGVPDPRFGQSVAAVVSVYAPASQAELIAHVRDRLAPYKAPRAVEVVATVPRADNGKADYPTARALFDAARAQSSA